MILALLSLFSVEIQAKEVDSQIAKFFVYVECFPDWYWKGIEIARACADARIEGFPTWGAIRRATIAQKFIPVFMGSAFQNKEVQPLLDGVLSYLPCPTEVSSYALHQNNNEEKVICLELQSDLLLLWNLNWKNSLLVSWIFKLCQKLHDV